MNYKASLLLLLCAPVVAVFAQAPSPNLAKQTIENRKAVFTLISSNFRPIGEVLRGSAAYESVDVAKYASRVSFLAGLIGEAFPEISKVGDTEAKADVWSNRADFDKRVKEFATHSTTLSQVVSHGGGNTDAFKSAARAVAQDCKSCHDAYRSR